MSNTAPAIQVTDVIKVYPRGRHRVVALNRMSLTVAHGEFVAITGPSGSGKSTLLNLIAGLDTPTEGEIYLEGTALSGLDDDALTDLRRTRMGVIFQFFNLLPDNSAYENVALPLQASGMSRSSVDARTRAALELVGMGNRLDHVPEELSGGEMQRVAIARALAIEPAILLADEPTGNLDSESGHDVLRMVRRLSEERHVSVLLVTHSPIASGYADRVISLRDGTVVDETVNRPPQSRASLRPVPFPGGRKPRES